MGQAYSYRCDSCGFEAIFNLGHGFQIHPQPLDKYLKGNVKLFHHKTHHAIKNLATQRKNLFLNAGFKIYKCPHCNLLYDKVSVTVYDDGTPIHKSEFRCTHCRARLKLTNIHRLKSASCPVCRENTFRSQPRKMILWE